MAYEQRDMSGSLFRNDKREKDSHPNATGSALIDGVEYWVSSWTKTDKNGHKWQSLAFKRKDAKPAAKGAGADYRAGKNGEPEFNDPLPF